MSAVNTQPLFRDSVEHAVSRAASRLASPAPSDSFAEKIRRVANVACKEEGFNVWHANNDKVTATFAWGDLSKRPD